MIVAELSIRNLRVVAEATLRLVPGVNLLAGANGSGKTSLLEAVHLLGTGRSFRSPRPEEYIRHGCERAVVRGRLEEDGVGDWLAIERSAGSVRIRRGNADVRTASELARWLPLVFVAPEAQRLLTDGAGLRRSLIDWLLFHVEHDYLELLQRYRRLLRQRNAALRDGTDDRALDAWDDPLVEAATALEAKRATELEDLLPRIEEEVGRLLGHPVDVRYAPGWNRETGLGAALAAGRAADRARGYTAAGPHRADLRFRADRHPAHRVLSRGEAKLFVMAVHLAEAAAVRARTGRAPVLLVDDLAAELDVDARARCFAELAGLGLQALVTAVPPAPAGVLDWGADRVFHVERGGVGEVV